MRLQAGTLLIASFLFTGSALPASGLQATLSQGSAQVTPNALTAMTSPGPGVSDADRIQLRLAGVFAGTNGTQPVVGSVWFVPGPSFLAGGDAIVTWLSGFEGELSLPGGKSPGPWTMRQYNFLNQSARVNFNISTSRTTIFLPALLTSPGRPEFHGFVVLLGRLDGSTLVVDTLRFGFVQMVARAFPQSEREVEALGLDWVGDTEPPPSGPGTLPCCMGPWCCSCSSQRTCALTTCPPACQDCYDGACVECSNSGCPSCCKQ